MASTRQEPAERRSRAAARRRSTPSPSTCSCPTWTGGRSFREIRSTVHNHNVTVVAVTASARREGATGFRLHDYLVKPLSAEALREALYRAGIGPPGVRPILVVDDDPVALKLAAALLRDLGHRSICAPGGEEGLRAAAQETPALVVLDLGMPGLDGFEFMARFRGQPAGRAVPIVVRTAKDLSQDERRKLRDSAQAVVSKAEVGASDLLEEVSHWLGPSRLRQGGENGG